MTTILITGATGGVGEHLVKILSLYDKEFYVSLRSTSWTNPLANRQIKTFRNQGLINFIDMDYNNLESISHHKLEGIEKIFLLTPYFNILDVTRKIVTEAQKTKSVKHIVKLSDMGTNLSPSICGGMRHRQAEKIIAESGLQYTFLRPNYYMQNFLKVSYRPSIKGKTFYLPLQNARASFVDIRDVAEVAATILHEKSNKHYDMVYDITGGQRLNCSDIADILETILGEHIHYVTMTEETSKTELVNGGLQSESIDYILGFYRIMREGRMRRISKTVETILGRKPISFETFARDHVELFKNKIEMKVTSH
jgi:uncharacterized protein YbjT (DUF2867 family)